MHSFFDFIEKVFFWLLKIVYYLMKLSFGLVVGIIIGLIFYFNLGNNIGKILFIIFTGSGFIAGIIYAEKSRKKPTSPYYNKSEPDLFVKKKTKTKIL